MWTAAGRSVNVFQVRYRRDEEEKKHLLWHTDTVPKRLITVDFDPSVAPYFAAKKNTKWETVYEKQTNVVPLEVNIGKRVVFWFFFALRQKKKETTKRYGTWYFSLFFFHLLKPHEISWRVRPYKTDALYVSSFRSLFLFSPNSGKTFARVVLLFVATFFLFLFLFFWWKRETDGSRGLAEKPRRTKSNAIRTHRRSPERPLRPPSPRVS